MGRLCPEKFDKFMKIYIYTISVVLGLIGLAVFVIGIVVHAVGDEEVAEYARIKIDSESYGQAGIVLGLVAICFSSMNIFSQRCDNFKCSCCNIFFSCIGAVVLIVTGAVFGLIGAGFLNKA